MGEKKREETQTTTSQHFQKRKEKKKVMLMCFRNASSKQKFREQDTLLNVPLSWKTWQYVCSQT